VAGEQFDKILQQACLELDKNWLPILEALRRSQLETRRAYVSELKAKLSEQHALLIAREFANAINKRSFEELNADEIHSKLTSLEEALNSSDTHLALKSCLSDVGAPYGTLKFGEVIIHAKQLWRRVRDNKPFTDEEQRALLEELRTSGKHFNVNFSGKVEGSPIVILKMVFGCDKEFVIDKFLWASDK
jgi:hypothetical protein